FGTRHLGFHFTERNAQILRYVKSRDELALILESGGGLAHRHTGREHRLKPGRELGIGIDLRCDSGMLMRIRIRMVIGTAVRVRLGIYRRIRMDVRMRSGTHRGPSTLGTCAGSDCRATAQAHAGAEAAVLCKSRSCCDDERG